MPNAAATKRKRIVAKSAVVEKRLTQVQVQALGRLVKQPELFEALEGILADLLADATLQCETAKGALLFTESARAGALVAHGRVLALADLADLLNRQKI
ncbi:hypothetical protein [Paraburkholderia dinghuensis]|uniref:Uncharacterized protein n=1 Tax=Paraburkholderia dinghuensis TaxID=2305225 RepID=A0A3N6N781_9BURK|nr:hypothetical protein [Paraburkholderia dinghuensis]RQH06631.1 hypothetical protein D1Y85_12220 [Paraburkholderia dinghuensis]